MKAILNKKERFASRSIPVETIRMIEAIRGTFDLPSRPSDADILVWLVTNEYRARGLDGEVK